MRRRGESPRQTRHAVPRAKNGGKDTGGEWPLQCDGDRERWGIKQRGVAGSDGKGMAHHGKEFGPYTESNKKPGRVLHCGVTLSDRCVLPRCLWQLPGEGPGRV